MKNLSKAPEGATHYHPVSSVWLRNIKPDSYEWTGNGVWERSEQTVYPFMLSQLIPVPRHAGLERWKLGYSALNLMDDGAIEAASIANIAIQKMIEGAS